MIDTSVDFRDDAFGQDPDKTSAKLREYHSELWSKPLPNGTDFDLAVTTTPRPGLHHRSQFGDLFISSDQITNTMQRRPSLRPILTGFSAAEQKTFVDFGYTIGASTIFPGYRVDNKCTINQARGMHPLIADRFDLTLECIRRHYRSEWSPLQATLHRYTDFFSLFDDFRGYVSFFLLQDLVSQDCTSVRFFTPFDNFAMSPVPNDLESYGNYRRRSIEFVTDRNRRIEQATQAA